jgi:transposase InsO family protein
MALCRRHPTHSSSHVREKLGPDAPCARTIQRVRKRDSIARVPKRAPPSAPARRIPEQVIKRARYLLKMRPHLGPKRVVWDLQNYEQLAISASTVKRLKRRIHDALHPAPVPPPPPVWRFYERRHPHSLWHGDFMDKITLTDTRQVAHQLTFQDDYSRAYVFCDLALDHDQRTVVRGLIAAMRAWQVIPNAVLFDNGSPFKGTLVETFCKKLGIRFIHSAVRHPQTNGKMERAFQDDMRDFYRQYDEWLLDHWRHDMPLYVHYRNSIGGHQALGGKPSIIRLREQTRVALPEVLDRLEEFACYQVSRTIIASDGTVPVLGRKGYVGQEFTGVEITLVETLAGLEARVGDQCIGVLWEYRDLQHLYPWELDKLLLVLSSRDKKGPSVRELLSHNDSGPLHTLGRMTTDGTPGIPGGSGELREQPLGLLGGQRSQSPR